MFNLPQGPLCELAAAPLGRQVLFGTIIHTGASRPDFAKTKPTRFAAHGHAALAGWVLPVRWGALYREQELADCTGGVGDPTCSDHAFD